MMATTDTAETSFGLFIQRPFRGIGLCYRLLTRVSFVFARHCGPSALRYRVDAGQKLVS